jgi:hypothetical protein
MTRHAVLGGLLVFALVVGAGWSQDPKKPADDKKDPTPKGTLPANWKKLGLTDDQVKKVYKIQSDYRTKIDTLQQQISDLKQKEKTDMEGVLTDAQKARLKELKTGDSDKPDKPEKPS